MALRKEKVTVEEALLAIIADRLGEIVYENPASIFDTIMEIEPKKKDNGVKSFDSAEEFDKAFYGEGKEE